MDEKIPCSECGKPVSAMQAAKRDGLCLRCKAKRNPFFVLYSSLIERVCNSLDGFERLSEAEKVYYALTLFQNEVNNGGFHQFFFNSSGGHFELIKHNLLAFNEPVLLALVNQAKQIVFPDCAVPVEKSKRRTSMSWTDSATDVIAELDALDRQFYNQPSTLEPKLEEFARTHGLVP